MIGVTKTIAQLPELASKLEVPPKKYMGITRINAIIQELIDTGRCPSLPHAAKRPATTTTKNPKKKKEDDYPCPECHQPFDPCINTSFKILAILQKNM